MSRPVGHFQPALAEACRRVLAAPALASRGHSVHATGCGGRLIVGDVLGERVRTVGVVPDRTLRGHSRTDRQECE